MTFSVLRIKPFRNLWLGQTVSQFGDAVYGLLFLYMTDKITQRPEMVGGVAAVTALPFLIFSPIAGVLADRLDRKRIMLTADFCSAGVLLLFAFLLVLSPKVPVWALFVTPFLLSSVNAFFMPSKGAAIPSLVPGDKLLEANSFASATFNLMHSVGLMMAAVLLGPLEAIDASQFFLTAVVVNLVTFLVSAVFVSRLPKLQPDRSDEHESHAFREFKEGFSVLTKHKVLRTLFAANIVVQLAISGFMVVYTATNRAWFDGKFSTLAFVELTFLAGMVASSAVVHRFKISRVGLWYSLGLFAVGVDVAAMGWARSIPLYVIGNVIAGLILPFVNVPFMTYLNLAVPNEYRGRINSFLTMVSAGAQPVGNVFSGTGLKAFGIVGMYVVMGSGMALAAMAPMLSRAVRAERIPENDPYGAPN